MSLGQESNPTLMTHLQRLGTFKSNDPGFHPGLSHAGPLALGMWGAYSPGRPVHQVYPCQFVGAETVATQQVHLRYRAIWLNRVTALGKEGCDGSG